MTRLLKSTLETEVSTGIGSEHDSVTSGVVPEGGIVPVGFVKL